MYYGSGKTGQTRKERNAFREYNHSQRHLVQEGIFN